MLKNIRLLQNIAKGYIIVSAVVIISMIFYQSFLDSDKSALNNYFIDQDNYIKEFSEKLEIEKLERHLLMRYIKTTQELDVNTTQELDPFLGDFLMSLKLIQMKKDSIKQLSERVYREDYIVKWIFGVISVFGLLLFSTIIFAVKKRNDMRQKEKRDWLYIAAHEMRSSVTPLKMGVDILLNINQSKSEHNQTLEIVANDAKNLENLTEQMLYLYDLSVTKSIEKKPVDIESIIQNVIHEIQSSNKKDLEFSCSIKIEQAILGNTILIERVIKNLIGNAIDFSHLKGVISIEAFNKDNFTIVNIIDQGIGIKDKRKILSSVVSPAKRIDEDGAISHHGLGLKFVRKIMNLHGGKFDINNNKDCKGATATIEFPL